MPNELLYRAQSWLADQGYGQYPPERRVYARPSGRVSILDPWVNAMAVLLALFASIAVIIVGLLGIGAIALIFIFVLH